MSTPIYRLYRLGPAYTPPHLRVVCAAYFSCMPLFGIVLRAAYVSSRPHSKRNTTPRFTLVARDLAHQRIISRTFRRMPFCVDTYIPSIPPRACINTTAPERSLCCLRQLHVLIRYCSACCARVVHVWSACGACLAWRV